MSSSLLHLAKLTKKMRATQKLYFATRDNSTLRESKKLEGQVDELCELIIKNHSRLSKAETAEFKEVDNG